MEGEKPSVGIVEEGEGLEVGERTHHYVATLFLNLAHLLELVGEAGVFEHFAPFRVLLDFLRIEAFEIPLLHLLVDLRFELEHFGHYLVGNLTRDAVGVDSLCKLEVAGADIRLKGVAVRQEHVDACERFG